MRIISFFSFKGGVGRTALLTNLGAHWAAQGRVVALMDLDLVAPGISYSPLLGRYLEPQAQGLDLGMSDLLATYHQSLSQGETFNFLPPSVLLREMELPKEAGTSGRLLAISAGSQVGDKKYIDASPALATGMVQGIPRPEGIHPDIADPATESPESRALRALAEHMRRDLTAWRIPPKRNGQDDPAAGRGIDYLLIDARTGFAELIHLSLGYLAHHMVLVSGLNDQNIEGLRLTMDALQEQKRVPLDEFPSLVTVVFSPIPTGEDDALLARLEYAHLALVEKLRHTRAGQRELAPQTFALHYTPLLAISEQLILPNRANSLYGREVRAVADHLAGDIQSEEFRDEFKEQARRNAMRLIEPPAESARATPVPASDARPNPLTDLPAWSWPLGDEIGSNGRAEFMDILLGKLPDGVRINPGAFLNTLAWSLSLSFDQKKQVLSSLPKLSQSQIDQLVEVLEQERAKFLKLWIEHPVDTAKLFVRCQREWAALVLKDESSADAQYLTESLAKGNLFPNAELWPEYWLEIAHEARKRLKKDELVLTAVERAIRQAHVDEMPTIAERIMELLPTEEAADKLQKALEEQARSIAPDNVWLDFLAARRLLNGPIKDPTAAETLLRPLLANPPEDAHKCYRLGVLVLDELPAIGAEAETVLRRAVELDPENAIPWNGLGNLLTDHLNRFEEAEDAYRRAIELDPKNAYPWNGLGILLKNHLNRHEEAETAYRRAVELAPKWAYPWNGLGNLLTDHLNRHEEAEDAYRRAIELDPKFAAPWNGLGLLQRNWQRDCQGALISFLEGLKRDDKNAYLHMNLGHTLQLLGQAGQEELKTALTLFDGLPSPAPNDSAGALWLALELAEEELVAKHLLICRQLAEKGRGEDTALALALADLVAVGVKAELATSAAESAASPGQDLEPAVQVLAQQIAGQPQTWGQYWDYIRSIHLLCGLRAEARVAGQAAVRELLALPAAVTDKYPDKARPEDWPERYLPFAGGESHGAGDPRERGVFCR